MSYSVVTLACVGLHVSGHFGSIDGLKTADFANNVSLIVVIDQVLTKCFVTGKGLSAYLARSESKQ
jgi:hypothetical protein